MTTRVAVVGAGMMGKLHARAWAEQPAVQVTAIIDPALALAETLASEVGARATSDLADGIASAQVVSICTPPHLHAAQVEAAAAQGADVLLEKPAAFSLGDYDRMQAAVDASGTRLMVGMTGRFYPEGRQAAGWLRDGAIGKPVAYAEHMHFDAGDLPDWYFQRATAGGGVLLTNGIHSIDRVLWLLQPRTVQILTATVRSLGGRGDVEDFADVLLDCDGILCRIQLLWQAGAGITRAVELVGTTGTMRIELYKGLALTNAAGQQAERPYPPQADFLERTLIGIRAEVAALLAARNAGLPAPSPLHENRRVFALIDRIYSEHAR